MAKLKEGEWEVGSDGRRFRRIGNCIEHEPEITLGGVSVPVSMADQYRQRLKESEERARQKELMEKKSLGSCPFKRGLKCSMQCAFYSDLGCMKSPETKGRSCPISGYKCAEDCMLYEAGCQFIKKWSENE